MPFNIELDQTYHEIAIKLQVHKCVITTYFNGPTEHIFNVGSQWTALESQFLKGPRFRDALPHGPYYVSRGTVPHLDRRHFKTHHTYEAETTISHSHVLFSDEVTPELFLEYLECMVTFQQVAPIPQDYNFFDLHEARAIANKYAYYVHEYTASGEKEKDELEREPAKKEQLMSSSSEEEKRSRTVLTHRRGDGVGSILRVIDNSAHPLFQAPPKKSTPVEDASSRCTIM